MVDNVAKKFIDNLNSLKTVRSNYDVVNQDITDYVLPNRGHFTRDSYVGEERDDTIYDSTAITASQNLASVIASGLTDPNTIWAKLKPKRPELKDNENVTRWLQDLENILFDIFSSSETGFAQQNHELLLDLIGYGTAIMFIGEDADKIVFQNRHLSEIWVEENFSGIVDTIYREYEITARQAEQEFSFENLGDKIKMCLEKVPHKKIKFVHVVVPKKDYERSVGKVPSELDIFDYIGLHISKDDEKTG